MNEISAFDKAYAKIIKLASVREQCTSQIRRRLLQDGYDEQVIDAAIERAHKYRILDDDRYAEQYVRSRLAAGKGRQGISASLVELGIDDSSLESLMDDFDCASEMDRALALLDRKPPRSKNLREGAFRKLVQNGFSTDVASSAARQWMDARR